MTDLLISINQKNDSYNLILVIINRLTKMRYYEPVKVIINTFKLAKVILDMIVRHYSLPDSIVSDWGSVFMSKFWLSFCYFLEIK